MTPDARGLDRAGPARERHPGPGRPRPRDGHGRQGRRRLEQLGRGPVALGHRRRAPRQRPAPRLRHAVGLVRQRPALPARLRRLPVRRRGRHVPGHAGRDRRPQRPHRVGRDQRQPRRPGPRRGEGGPRRSREVPHRGRLGAVHGPHRDHQGRRRRRRHAHGPRDPSRAGDQRTWTTASRQRAPCTPCAGRPSPSRTACPRPSSTSTGPPTGRRSAPPSPSSAPRRRTSSTRTRTATSATSCRARSRSAPSPRDIGDRPVPGWDGQHEWESYVPFDDLPSVFDPPSGRIVTANNAVYSDKAFIGAEFDRGDRAARILELIDAAGDQVTPRHLLRHPGRHASSAVPRGSRRRCWTSSPAPATEDGAAVSRPSPAGTAGATRAPPAAPRTWSSRTRWCGPSSTTSWGRWPGTTSAPTSRPTSPPRSSARPRASRPPGGVTRRPGSRRPLPTSVAAALDTAGAQLRRDLGEPSGWTWGRIHTDPVPRVHPGRQRHRPARVVLQRARGHPSTVPTAP